MSDIERLNELEEKVLKNSISGWARQSRYRASQSGIYVDLPFDEIIKSYEELNWKCVYCKEKAGTPDFPFPLKESGPCITANCLPCCEKCKLDKRQGSLFRFYKRKHITKEQMVTILKYMLSKDKDGKLKEYLNNELFINDLSNVT